MSKIDIPNWRKFKVSDLFEVKIGNVDLQQKDVNGKGVALVSSGEANAGVIGLTDVKAKIIPKNTITVDMFGSVNYRDFPYKMVTHARVFALIPNAPINQETGLYLASVLQKQTTMYSYNNMCSWNKIKSLELLLPVTPQSTPDWDYMQEYIVTLQHEYVAELEQERIAELEQYLIATGLNDYTLTDEDLKILSSSAPRKGGERAGDARVRKEMREFYVGRTEFHVGLFEQLRGKEAAPNRVPDGLVNMINETSSNNGITKKASSLTVFSAPAITVSVNYAETVFLQDSPFCASVNILVLRSDWLSRYRDAGLYIVSLLRKNNVRYDYSHKISKDKLNDTTLSLPIQTDPSNHPIIDPAHTYHPDGFIPDWDYMAAYIRAIEKLVIKDVVDFKNEFIAKARGVVG